MNDTAADPNTDWLSVGRKYLAMNAAASGADVIIAGLCDEVESLRMDQRLNTLEQRVGRLESEAMAHGW